MDRKVLAFGCFTSSVPIELSHPFAAETCGVPSTIITFDHVLIKNLNSSTKMKIIAGLDYQSGLNNPQNVCSIITWEKQLHQVRLETNQTQKLLNTIIKLEKTKED